VGARCDRGEEPLARQGVQGVREGPWRMEDDHAHGRFEILSGMKGALDSMNMKEKRRAARGGR